MARRVVLSSDLTGKDIPEGEEVVVRVLELDGLSQPVRLDAAKIEVDRLQVETSSLALLELVMPSGETVRLAIPADQFKKAIKGDADEILSKAESLSFAPQQEEPRRRGRRPRGEGVPPAERGEKVNYTDEDKYGQTHRGRLTDQEVELVIRNPAQASKNREAQGNGPIDWDSEKEQQRYHLDDTLVADIKKRMAE